MRLQQIDFKVLHRKLEDIVVPDTLSRFVPHPESVFEISNSDSSMTIKDKWYQNMMEKVQKHTKGFCNRRVNSGFLLKHVAPMYPELSQPVDAWKRVVPKEERPLLISQEHEPPTLGHVGMYKLAEQYYWRNVTKFYKLFEDVAFVLGSVSSPPRSTVPSKLFVSTPWERSLSPKRYLSFVSSY